MKIKDLKANIDQYATVENAKEWSSLTDQFVFCIDLLLISAWDNNADRLVDILEAKFEEVLAVEA